MKNVSLAELAKEFGISRERLAEYFKDIGIRVRPNQASIGPGTCDKIVDYLSDLAPEGAKRARKRLDELMAAAKAKAAKKAAAEAKKKAAEAKKAKAKAAKAKTAKAAKGKAPKKASAAKAKAPVKKKAAKPETAAAKAPAEEPDASAAVVKPPVSGVRIVPAAAAPPAAPPKAEPAPQKPAAPSSPAAQVKTPVKAKPSTPRPAQPFKKTPPPQPREAAPKPGAPKTLVATRPTAIPQGPRPSIRPLTTPAGARGIARPTRPRRPARKPVRPAQPRPERVAKKRVDVEKPKPTGPVYLSEGVTVKELAAKLDIKSKDVIRLLMTKGVLASINQNLDPELAIEICKECEREASVITFEEEVTLEEQKQVDTEEMTVRHPVVTIMGHVDHGKTSLLDAIRKSKIQDKEAGNITQHIGAYHVRLKSGTVVFLDTPGHEAFTRMRARGAKVTDIVVLVVAADDGVMQQTLEAINHARAAEVPIVVAINKIDVPNANVDRVYQRLADHDLLSEKWGGQTVCVEVSAKTGKGIDELLEMIQLVSELQELKANPKRLATGVVLEAKLDKARGAVATVLVQNGMLHVGHSFVAGSVYGKVRAMYDEFGEKVEHAGPSHPVEIIGLQGVPRAGDQFQVVTQDWKARQIGSFRQSRLRDQSMLKSSRVTLDHLFQQIKEGSIKELPVIVKGDVQGSVEVVSETLVGLSGEKVRINIIHSATGGITENDVLLASASNAIIVGFNVRPSSGAADLAVRESVDIRFYSVIYEIEAEIKKALLGMLDPTTEEVNSGIAEIRDVFRIPKVGNIAGCFVREGKISRDCRVRIVRDSVVIHTGRISSLKRFKEDASEVRTGYECGIGVERFNDIKVGDVIEAFKVTTSAAELT